MSTPRRDLRFARLLLLPLTFGPCARLMADEYVAGSADGNIEGLAYRGWILVIAIAIAWVARMLMISRMRSLMQKRARDASEPSVDGYEGKEVSATKDLVVTELTADSALTDAENLREGLLTAARQGMTRLLTADLAAIAVYTVAITVILWDELLVWQDDSAGLFLRFYLYLGLLLVWNLMRFIGHRHQFRAYRKGVLGGLQSVWKLIFWLFETRWCLFWAAVVMFTALITAPYFGMLGLLLVGAVACHLLLLYRLKKSGRRRSNIKLLILRVFAQSESSSFTFNGLVNFWRHFGSYFTVADPVFYRINWKKKYNYYFPVYILVVFAIYTQLTDDNKEAESQIFGGFVVLLLILALLYLVGSLSRMRRQFTSTEVSLRQRLERLERWPTRLDGTFKDLPVMCFDNTWKTAVEVFVDTANVVMMDLRGFSETNKGCEYEVDFLFDSFPAERIVFVANSDSVPLIRTLIAQRWSMLRRGSPNLETAAPGTTLFVTDKQNRREIQGIIDVLLQNAGIPAGA